MLHVLIPLLLIQVPPSSDSSTLIVDGPPQMSYKGYCLKQKRPEIKKIEGRTSSEVIIPFDIEECKVSVEESAAKDPPSAAPISISLFQNRQLLYHRKIESPYFGVEISIPIAKILAGRKRVSEP